MTTTPHPYPLAQLRTVAPLAWAAVCRHDSVDTLRHALAASLAGFPVVAESILATDVHREAARRAASGEGWPDMTVRPEPAPASSTPPPMVEVLTVRDPDGGTAVDLWVDGAPLDWSRATLVTIDPGAGCESREDWRARADVEGSPAFVAAVGAAVESWESVAERFALDLGGWTDEDEDDGCECYPPNLYGRHGHACPLYSEEG